MGHMNPVNTRLISVVFFFDGGLLAAAGVAISLSVEPTATLTPIPLTF